MKKSYRKIFFVSMAMAVLLGGCANGSGTESPKNAENNFAQEAAKPQETQSAGIVFEGPDVNGNSVSETIFSQSKLTMVNVWATYCNPCLSEMPGLGELAGEYEPGEFQIVGVISDVTEDADEETIATAEELIDATGADYTHLLLIQK